MEIFKIVTLSLSGLLLTFAGSMRLSKPIQTYSKNSGIQLENSVDLLNEIRGISALMLSGGIITLLGILIPQIRTLSFMAASLIFIGFAIGRIVSMIADGKPNKQLNQGLMFELVFGAMNVACLVLSLG